MIEDMKKNNINFPIKALIGWSIGVPNLGDQSRISEWEIDSTIPMLEEMNNEF